VLDGIDLKLDRMGRDVDALRHGAKLAQTENTITGGNLTHAIQAGTIHHLTIGGPSPSVPAPAGPVGELLAQLEDPFASEVHRPVDLEDAPSDLAVLPAYVPRRHDARLAEVVGETADGASRVAVLVGGSSTGKTRACWEALAALWEHPEPWRLWHPIRPTRPGTALDGLDRVAPYTVIWLNEAQFYLDTGTSDLGERLAAGLRDLLRDASRGPVLILARLWPEHWTTLTTRNEADRHAQARELLDGRAITVPDAFTDADLDALSTRIGQDPRLAEAAGSTRDGQITQYLAGVPVLLDRYRNATPATKALIHAAMDARRLVAPRVFRVRP
jgi:hypothetical protein